jgi:hypothetical protein
MKEKIKKYFEILEKLQNLTEDPNSGTMKLRLRDVSKRIRKVSVQLADPAVNMTEVMAKLTQLREEQQKVLEAMKVSPEFDRNQLKMNLIEVRQDILEAKYTDNWDSLVKQFSDNPVALTALMFQAGYEQTESTHTLRRIPFRGRVAGPYGARYEYVVTLKNGKKKSYGSVRKIIVELDQYNSDFRSLALTFETLKRYLATGLTMGSVPVVSIKRNSLAETE